MKKYNVGPITMLLIVAVFFAALFGWVWNVVEIFSMLDGPVNAEFVFRVIGIFVGPIGAILGYF